MNVRDASNITEDAVKRSSLRQRSAEEDKGFRVINYCIPEKVMTLISTVKFDSDAAISVSEVILESRHRIFFVSGCNCRQ